MSTVPAPPPLTDEDNLRERLQAIIDWADMALANKAEFDKHGVRNLDGPVFDEARAALAASREKRRGSVPSVEEIERVISAHVRADDDERIGLHITGTWAAAQAIASLTADGGGGELSADVEHFCVNMSEDGRGVRVAVGRNYARLDITGALAAAHNLNRIAARIALGDPMKGGSLQTQRPGSAGGETPAPETPNVG